MSHEIKGLNDLIELESGLVLRPQGWQELTDEAGNETRKKGGKALKVGRVGFSLLAATLGVFGIPSGDHQGLPDQDSGLAINPLNPDTAYAHSELQTQSMPPCETYIRCVPFAYGGMNWKWALDPAMAPDSRLVPYQAGLAAPGIVVFRQERPNSDFTYYSQFVLPNVDPATGGRLGIADVMVDISLGKAVLPTVAAAGNMAYPRGGFLITDLINPQSVNNRIRIPDEGLPSQAEGNNWEFTKYAQRGSELFLARSFTDAIPASENGDRSILADRNGFIVGTVWNIDQPVPTLIPTRIVTATVIPSPTIMIPTASPTPESITIGASRVELNNSPIGLAWRRGQGVTNYQVLRAYRGITEVPPNGNLPGGMEGYTELSRINDLAFYMVLSFSGTQLIDYSNLFGYIPVPGSFGISEGIRIMQDRDVATLSLAPTDLDRVLVAFFPGSQNELIPVQRGSLTVNYNTGGRPFCYLEARVQNSALAALSNAVCGIKLPRATVAAGR